MVFEKVEKGNLKSVRCINTRCKKIIWLVRGHHYIIKKGIKILNEKRECPYCKKEQYVPIIFKREKDAEGGIFLVLSAGLKNSERFI